MQHTLKIVNFHVSVENKKILRGISLTVRSGEVHAVMGPNGSGKSTLANALMGHPSYQITDSKSKILMDAKKILDMPPEDRAKAGLFLAFQSPIAVAGVSVVHLLRTVYQQVETKKSVRKTMPQNPLFSGGDMSMVAFVKRVKDLARTLHIEESFLSRGINDGFSGGEKKKMEMLQAMVLAPKFAVFDEIDTGLDVDALKIVSDGITYLTSHGTGVIVITHYQRILKYVRPDVVHVLVKGKIAQTGDATLAKKIEDHGYSSFV